MFWRIPVADKQLILWNMDWEFEGFEQHKMYIPWQGLEKIIELQLLDSAQEKCFAILSLFKCIYLQLQEWGEGRYGPLMLSDRALIKFFCLTCCFCISKSERSICPPFSPLTRLVLSSTGSLFLDECLGCLPHFFNSPFRSDWKV